VLAGVIQDASLKAGLTDARIAQVPLWAPHVELPALARESNGRFARFSSGGERTVLR